MFRTTSFTLFLAVALSLSGNAQQNAKLADLKTTPEATGYKATSTYDDVVKFMKTVDEASPLVFYTTYGKTYDGRDMPLTVVGAGLKDASPAAVRTLANAAGELDGIKVTVDFNDE